MTEFSFYHLTSTSLEKALPRLLEKIILTKQNTLILNESKEKLKQLNESLWTFSTRSFLPHGTKDDGFASEQPIYLSDVFENPNNATILVITDGRVPEDLSGFTKCLYMFDGNNEEQLQIVRERWNFYKKADKSITYWKQQANGSWEQG